MANTGNDPDKAELIQSIQAYYIPASLFIATIIFASGVFLIYSSYSLGYALLALSAIMYISSILMFIHFQNKLRADGHLPQKGNDN